MQASTSANVTFLTFCTRSCLQKQQRTRLGRFLVFTTWLTGWHLTICQRCFEKKDWMIQGGRLVPFQLRYQKQACLQEARLWGWPAVHPDCRVLWIPPSQEEATVRLDNTEEGKALHQPAWGDKYSLINKKITPCRRFSEAFFKNWNEQLMNQSYF